ncbi:MAG: acyl transferase [Saprospiraceae bacterium]
MEPLDQYWQDRIRRECERDAEQLAMDLFAWQAKENGLYREFCRLVHRRPDHIRDRNEIPFLPISFFKSHVLTSGSWTPTLFFRSSGTTGMVSSRHGVRDLDWYLEVARRGFSEQFGDPSEWCWLALLPGYLEREGSSLITMVDAFIRGSRHAESGFFLRNVEDLLLTVEKVARREIPVMVIGVTFALLQLAEHHLTWGPGVRVMETGGMKGMGPELIRTELHDRLIRGLGVPSITSEYGMTELFSQAYLREDGRFVPASTLWVTTRDIHDPFAFPGYGRTGRLCMIDLANYATQAFIQTDDLGRVFEDGSFEVLGRMDGSDIRGCNLLVSELPR